MLARNLRLFNHLERIWAKKTAPCGAVREVHCAQSLYPSRKAIREGYLLQRQKTEGDGETIKMANVRKGFFERTGRSFVPRNGYDYWRI